MNKLRIQKLVSFGLNTGEYGVATELEIVKMCEEIGTRVYNQTLATYDDCEWMVCSSGELIAVGLYLIEGGFLCVTGESEDYELNFIKFREESEVA